MFTDLCARINIATAPSMPRRSKTSKGNGGKRAQKASYLEPDCRRPPAEEAYSRRYDGYDNFMLSFGLKPTDIGDVQEGQAILDTFIEAERERRR